jgi:hypothetical protein
MNRVVFGLIVGWLVAISLQRAGRVSKTRRVAIDGRDRRWRHESTNFSLRAGLRRNHPGRACDRRRVPPSRLPRPGWPRPDGRRGPGVPGRQPNRQASATDHQPAPPADLRPALHHDLAASAPPRGGHEPAVPGLRIRVRVLAPRPICAKRAVRPVGPGTPHHSVGPAEWGRGLNPQIATNPSPISYYYRQGGEAREPGVLVGPRVPWPAARVCPVS